MKKKTKFFMVAAALCLTITLGVLGIFAVKTLNMSVGGNITFSADGISFEVSDGTFKTAAGAAYDGILSDSTKLKGFAMDTDTTKASVQTQIDSWTNLDLRMSSLGDAVLHFTVTNKMETTPLYVVMTITMGTNQNNNMNILVSPNKVAIPAGGTASQEYTITFDILDELINASLTGFKVNVEITPNEPPAEGSQTQSGLKRPTDEETYIQPEMVMETPEFYVETDSSLTRKGSIRIVCSISPELKTEVEADSTKQFALLLNPLAYFNKVNPNNLTYVDWITEFNKAGMGNTYILSKFETSKLGQSNGRYTFATRLQNVPYNGMSTKLAGIGVLITTIDGVESYQYASFKDGEDYRSCTYSLGELAHMALNKVTMGITTFSDEKLQVVKDFANEFVDLANKLTEPTYDDSIFDFSINLGIPSAFAVGQKVDMQVQTTPSATVPMVYISSDESVATVDKYGVLTAVGAGTATISVYVSGVMKSVTIKVA